MKTILISLCLISFSISKISGQTTRLDSVKSIKNACVEPCPGDSVKLRLLAQSTEICEMEEILPYATAAIELADAILYDAKDLSAEQKSTVLKYKVQAVSNCAFFYQQTGDNPRALNAYGKSLRIFGELNDKSGTSNALNNIAFIYNFNGDFFKALDYYKRSLKLREEAGDKHATATSLYNIGRIYNDRANVGQALEYYGRSLKLFEDTGDKSKIADLFNDLGNLYFSQHDDEKAFENYHQSLKLREQTGDKDGIANSLHNIGMMYSETTGKRDLDKALEYFNRSLKILEETQYKKGLATMFTSIGNIHEKRGDSETALKSYKKSLETFTEIRDQEGVASSLAHIGDALSDLKKYKLADSFASRSNTLARKLGLIEHIRSAEESLYRIYGAMGSYEAAFAHYKQFIVYNDSLSNQKTRSASIRHQLKFEFEKKEEVLNKQQEKEREVAEEKHTRQQIVIGVVFSGLILVIVFAGFVFRTLKTTRRQKTIIEEKQKEILDSIYYAKRIQRSLLPQEKYIDKNLKRLLKN